MTNEPEGMGCAKSPDPRENYNEPDNDRERELWAELETSLENVGDDPTEDVEALLEKLSVTAANAKNRKLANLPDDKEMDKLREYARDLKRVVNDWEILVDFLQS